MKNALGPWLRYAQTLQQIIAQNARHLLRFAIVLGAIIFSILLGVTQADVINMPWYPILAWLITVALGFIFLWPSQTFQIHFGRTFWLLSGLVFVSLLLRVVFLETLPPGFIVDEAGTVDFTLRHIARIPSETISPFRTGNDSQPVLYYYILRLTMELGGYNIAAARISSAIAGALAVAATFLLVDTFSGRRTAWFTALLMAAYHYHIHWSRIALNNIWTTLWVPLTVFLFFWGWKKRWTGAAILAGFVMGLSAFFYQGGHLLLFLLIFLFFNLWRNTPEKLDLLIYGLKMIAMGLIVAGPLMAFALIRSEMYSDRLQTIWGWNEAALFAAIGPEGRWWDYFWHQLIRSLGAYNFFLDGTTFYASGAPLLIGLASPLFVIGILFALFERQYLPPLWVLLTMFFGGFLLTAPPGSTHYVVSIPAVCWILGIMLNGVFSRGYASLGLALLLTILVSDLFFYFAIYRTNPSPSFDMPFPYLDFLR